MTFLGGATGLYCGYLDFIAWDLPAVLTAAQAFLEESGLPYAHFHAFRRDVGGVPLLDEEDQSLTSTRKPAPCSRKKILKRWNPLTKAFPAILGKCSTGWRILSKMA